MHVLTKLIPNEHAITHQKPKKSFGTAWAMEDGMMIISFFVDVGRKFSYSIWIRNLIVTQ